MANSNFSASHIELRYRTYFAILYVPKDVRMEIGKTKFSKSTRTSDKSLAEKRAAAFVAAWQQQINHARNNPSDPVIAEAQDLLFQLKHSSSPENVKEIIEQTADQLPTAIGDEFKQIAYGTAKSLSGLVPGWVQYEKSKDLKPKTIERLEKDVTILTKQAYTVQNLNHEVVERWLITMAAQHNFTASTVNRLVGSFNSFFRYLKLIGEVPKKTISPFVVPEQFVRTKKKNAKGSNKITPWVALTQEELAECYGQALQTEDKKLAQLIAVAAYTGARIEELCSLKCADIKEEKGFLNIADAKTEAGIRTVPIHHEIVALVGNLKKGSSDGYLFDGLTFNKYNLRSNAIGKRFGRLKKKLGYSEKKVFHSIRKSFVTELENCGVPENVAADIVGHEKKDITYGLYSGGNILEVKREAIERVRFPLLNVSLSL
jgi:integrase